MMAIFANNTMSDDEIRSAALAYAQRNLSKSSREGFVYYAVFTNGLIKVGKRRFKPESRIACHVSTARIASATLIDSGFRQVLGFDALESFIVSSMTSQNECVSREWFVSSDVAFIRRIIDAWSEVTSTDEFKEKALERSTAKTEKQDAWLSKMYPDLKAGESGVAWKSCLGFAKSLAERAQRSGTAHEQFFSKIEGRNLNYAELLLWLYIYDLPPDAWFDLTDLAEEAAGELFMYAEEFMQEKVKEVGL